MQQSPTHLNPEPKPSVDGQNNSQQTPAQQSASAELSAKLSATVVESQDQPKELGGRDGPEPTRFGDWEKAGRCIDF